MSLMHFNLTWMILAFSFHVDFGLISLVTSIYVKQNQANETAKDNATEPAGTTNGKSRYMLSNHIFPKRGAGGPRRPLS